MSPATRRDEEEDRPHGVIVADRLVRASVSMAVRISFSPICRLDWYRPRTSLRPGDVGLDAGFERGGVDAGLRELLGQLVGREPHTARHRGVGRVDLGIADFQPEFLGLAQLELLVDQLIQHFLTWQGPYASTVGKFAALIDVERGDRLAVDDDDDLLRAGGGCRDRGGKHEKRGSHQFAECHETIEHHRSIRFLADARP